MRTGKAKIYTDIPDSMLIALAQDAEHFKILQELGLASAMVVPLVARGRTLGAITFASENPARRYAQEDLNFAEELARRAALGIDNAKLYGDAQNALKEVQAKTDEIQRIVAIARRARGLHSRLAPGRNSSGLSRTRVFLPRIARRFRGRRHVDNPCSARLFFSPW